MSVNVAYRTLQYSSSVDGDCKYSFPPIA